MNIHSKPGYAKGLRPAVEGKPKLKFGDFLTQLPNVPIVNTIPILNYPMDGNDQVGDCVVAAFDHAMQTITALLTGTGINFTQEQIWQFYQTQNPNFDPNGTAETNGPGSQYDCGMNIQEFLQYLQKNGYILGFAAIDYTNQAEFQAAIYIGLAVMCGVTLDDIQMQQFQTGTWTNVPGDAVDGGHGVPYVAYNQSGASCVTWAQVVQCTESFITKQMTEAYFILTKYHIAHPNFRDNFDLEGFAQAVKEITDGNILIGVPAEPTMTTVNIVRQPSDAKETEGTLTAGLFTCKTLERSYVNNEPNVSAIPQGTYQCVWTFMPDMGTYHYELQNVQGRTGIFIHNGNFYTDSEGCILLGASFADINGDGEPDVTSSDATLAQFEALLNTKPFTLVIT